ncbi:MAG: alpha/beta hydrolase, partial [Chloroflexi bacterium]
NEDYRQAYLVSKWNRWLLKALLSLQMWQEKRDPQRAWDQILARASENDRNILMRPEVAEQVRAYRPEAVRNGVDGWVHEAKLLVKPWGFPMNDVPHQVHLWYWEQDTIVPLQMGRFISKTLPNAVEHFLPGGGHFSWIDHWREILESVL